MALVHCDQLFDGFDKVDDHNTLQAIDTAVTRNSNNGCVNIANLRVTARKLLGSNYLTDGMAPDNKEPGLFFTEGALTGQLALRDDGRIVHMYHDGQPDERSYRFGVAPQQWVDENNHSLGYDDRADHDGLLIENADEQIKLCLPVDDKRSSGQ